MNRILLVLIALFVAIPLIGCSKSDESTGPIKVNGQTPDIKGHAGDNNQPVGNTAQQTL